MHIEGKDIPGGNYLFQRFMMKNGENVIVNTYKIKSTKDGYEFYDSEKEMAEVIRRIELRRSKKRGLFALIWTVGSRFGLLYTIKMDIEEKVV
jgi:hypothetical protein